MRKDEIGRIKKTGKHFNNSLPLLLILQTLQRGDLRMKPSGNLLKFFCSRRLNLLNVFHRGLLFRCGLAIFGLEELLLGFFDLDVHFLRRSRKFLQRRRAENIFPILHGHGGKVGNRLFYFFDGIGIYGRLGW